ncbi:Tubulin epsilon chain [Globomyces sp. JEL0801]|nr:Tubulin epsilon chain [Globomyces sp. JEL0801]
MPQSILIQVGQCGNQIGSQFWNLALQEHAKNNTDGVYDESQSSFFRHVDPKNGMENIPILNSQNPTFNSKIVHLKARGLMIDMEENVINQILSSPLNHLFDHRQIIKSNSGSGNNWAQGYHQYGNEFNDSILNTLQKELEFCDSLQSFILLQSLGGGTGSGLGSYITELIRNEFPNVYSFNTGIIPSINDDVVTSPYNSIYEKITKSTKDIRKSATSLIDNGDNQRKIYNQSQKNEAFKTMNNIVANLLLNMTRIRKQLRFVPWNPDGWKTGLCDVPPLGQAHLHHYTEYMDKSEFDEAKSSVQNMIQGYQDIESQTVT